MLRILIEALINIDCVQNNNIVQRKLCSAIVPFTAVK